MTKVIWIFLSLEAFLGFTKGENQTENNAATDWSGSTVTDVFDVTDLDDYNTSEASEAELRIEDIDFGYGRECALKVIYDYRHLFEEITNELLQCTCFGLCEDTSDEERDRILKDLKAKLAKRDSYDDIPIFVTYIAVMVVGIVGNILVLVTVIWIFKAASVTNMFICSLAVADLIVVTICIPFRILDYVGDEIWRLGVEACKFIVFVYFASFMCSVFTLTAMSLERYMVICHPMKAASKSTTGRAKKVILITWLAALVLAVPSAVTSGIHDYECATSSADMRDWRGPLYMYLTVAIFAVPSVLMGFSYTSTAIALWKSVKNVNKMKGGGENEKVKEQSTEIKARIQVIRMLVLVWVMFVLTWGPDLIFNCVVSYWGDIDLKMTGGQATIMVQTFGLLTMANSAMNPVLYAFMSRQFRRGFMKVFLCVPCIRKRYEAEPSSAVTGVSTVRSSAGPVSNGAEKSVSVNPSA